MKQRNSLDAAIDGLLAAQRNLIGERNLIDKQLGRIEKALASFGVDSDYAAPRRPRRARQGQEEYGRRRAVLDAYVESLRPGDEFTARDVLEATGEPPWLAKYYADAALNMIRSGDPRLSIAREKSGQSPRLHRREP